MRIQTIHRNTMGDVFNECSAHGFRITTADGGCITIMVDGDGLARAEPPSAPAAVEGFDEWYDSVDARFWDNRDACNAAFHAGKRAALAQRPAPSAPVGAEDIEVLKRLREALHDASMNGWWLGVEVLDRVIAALTQQQEPKTLPVPTRVYLIGETAVIAGTPQRGWDEEGLDAHNCDDMGCSTFGRHVLARVPFTDERALPTQQGGGEINMDVTVRDGAWVGTYAEWCRRKQPTAAQQQGGAE